MLALVRARRGDPGADAALDDAAAVGVPPDDVGVHVDLAAARAEVAWLEQRPDAVDEATERMLAAALDRGDAPQPSPGSASGAGWQGLDATQPDAADGPYALALAGEWAAAAASGRGRASRTRRRWR